MRIAVTGASGFIGHYIISELSLKGIEIVAVVRNIEKFRNLQSVAEIIELDMQSNCVDSYTGSTGSVIV